MVEKKERPVLGSTITTSVIAKKARTKISGSLDFEVTWECSYKIFKITGIYVGYRFVFEGSTESDTEYLGSYVSTVRWFKPKKAIEIWLIAYDPRKEPVKAFPEYCIWEH